MTQPLFRSEVERFVRPDGITVVNRQPFARSFSHIYKPGHHCVFGGPSTHGKTTLAFDLMACICTPNFPGYCAQSKPDDDVTVQRGAELHFRTVSEWPPPTKLGEMAAFGGQKPSGYIVAPHFGNLNEDMDRCAALTGKLLMERYSTGADPKKRKPGILMMDDTMVKAKLMGQDSNMVTIIAMGSALGLGMWVFVQRPADSGRTALWGFENAKHLFLTKGGDRQMLKRYAEILGEHGPLAMQVIPTLGKFEFLYVNRDEGYMCIVGAN